MRTTKYQRLFEAVSENGELLNKFVEQFGDVADEDMEAPEVEVALNDFADENKINLLEYDISKLNLKVGTILELNDLEDMLELTRGDFRKELSLFVNDGGVLAVKIIKNSSSTVNGIVVKVDIISGESDLAREEVIVKAIKNTLENGDLSFLLEEEETNLNLEPLPFEKMVENLSSDDLKQLITETCSQEGRQKMTESEENGSEFELSDEDKQSMFEAMKPMFEFDSQEGYERVPNVSQDDLKGMMEGASCKPRMLESITDGCLIYDETGNKCGIYNATTESLDCQEGSKLLEEAKSASQQRLFGQAYAIRTGEQSRDGATEEVLKIVDGDMSTEEIKKFASTDTEDLPERITEGQVVRVAKPSAKDFNAYLKTNGIDFSEVDLPSGAFNEFYINEKSKEETKKLVSDAFAKNIKAVLVENANGEQDNGEQVAPKQYADVIVENADGEILLLQRNENDTLEPNKFGFAGGKIEEGETPEEAGMRELLEETGLNVDSVEAVKTIENPDGSTSHYFKTSVDDDQFVTISDEHQGVKWVKPEELTEMEDIIFDNNDRYSELCGGSKLNENADDNKIDVGQDIIDLEGKTWNVQSMDDNGFMLVSGDETKTLPFAEVDTFLGKYMKYVKRLIESVDVSKFRLKEGDEAELARQKADKEAELAKKDEEAEERFAEERKKIKERKTAIKDLKIDIGEAQRSLYDLPDAKKGRVEDKIKLMREELKLREDKLALDEDLLSLREELAQEDDDETKAKINAEIEIIRGKLDIIKAKKQKWLDRKEKIKEKYETAKEQGGKVGDAFLGEDKVYD